MAQTPIFEWEGREYQFEEKTADWYWALGIVATAAAIACILFGNFLLALVILTAATAVALTAAKNPRVHRFSILQNGIAVDTNFYPFENMLHFSVLEYADPALPASLSIKTKSFLSPHILIPIIGHDPLEIYDFMLLHLDDGWHEESAMDRVVELFRL